MTTQFIKHLCAPALIYLLFSITSIVIDFYYRLYEDGIIKFFVSFFVTFLLNELCKRGLKTISWLIVFIPFIMMTFIIATIILMFGFKLKDNSI